MTFDTSEPGPVTEPPGDVQAGPPGGPELGPRPYVRLMAAIGGIGIVAAVAAAIVGLTTDPVFRLPETMPSMPTPGQTSLPSGFLTAFPTELPSDLPTDYTRPTSLPSDFPTGFPTGFPTELPTDFPTALPTDLPELPSDFPSLPDFSPAGGAS
ncbi:PT domain-containing protein [Streptomyces sp. R28]|uniref:PT domain-containing protein n=1 Tax=Streptomyces sp. R28 TaxID=3238628 RepID=A0AB39PZC2_9ACTN